MKIYFARHGQYQNPEGVVPYRLPGFPLTELGISQAKLQAEKLLSVNIRDIFTSPITRCVETASIIGKIIKLAPNMTDGLIETGTPLQGMTLFERNKIQGDFPYNLQSHLDGGGETMEAIIERISNFVAKLTTMSKNSSHLIVSHGDPINFYLNAVLKKEVRYIPMGGLVMLDYSQKGFPKYSEII